MTWQEKDCDVGMTLRQHWLHEIMENMYCQVAVSVIETMFVGHCCSGCRRLCYNEIDCQDIGLMQLWPFSVTEFIRDPTGSFFQSALVGSTAGRA